MKCALMRLRYGIFWVADEAAQDGATSKSPPYDPAQAAAYAASRFPATYSVLQKVWPRQRPGTV